MGFTVGKRRVKVKGCVRGCVHELYVIPSSRTMALSCSEVHQVPLAHCCARLVPTQQLRFSSGEGVSTLSLSWEVLYSFGLSSTLEMWISGDSFHPFVLQLCVVWQCIFKNVTPKWLKMLNSFKNIQAQSCLSRHFIPKSSFSTAMLVVKQ